MGTEIEECVHRFILRNFLYTEEPRALRHRDSLIEKGILDSTGVLELVAFIDQQFGIRMTHAEMIPENLDSVASIAAFVRARGHGGEMCG